MLLSIAESGGVHDIELDVMAAEAEVGADELTELGEVLLFLEYLRYQALVEQGTAGKALVELAQGLDHGCGSVGVGAVRGRCTVRDGQEGVASVGRGSEDLAEVDVAGGGEHVHVIARALDVGTALDGLEEVVVHTHCDGIGVLVVVAEERGVVDNPLAVELMTLEVSLEHLQHPVHGIAAFLEDMLLDRGHGVGDGAEACALDVVGVVAGTAVVVVLALGDAVVDEDGKEGGWSVLREHAVDVVVDLYLLEHHVFELLQESRVQVLEGPELPGVAGGDADLTAGDGIHTVVQSQFQKFGHVQIACEQICLLAEGADLDTAAAASLTGVLQALALTDEFLDVCVGIEEGRIAVSETDDLAGGLDQVVGGLPAHVYGAAGLEDVQFPEHLQEDVGHLALSGGAVALDSAYVDVGEIVVCAALLGRDAHLGRSGMVVDLDPEAADVLLGLLAGEGAGSRLFLIEGSQMLIEVPGIHGVPAVELENRAEVAEPVHLYGLAECPGSILRYPRADLDDVLEFLDTAPVSVLLSLSGERSHLEGRASGQSLLYPGYLLACLVCMTASEQNQGVAGDGHGPEFLLLVGGFGIIEEVQLGKLLVDTGLEVLHAHAVHLAVQGSMAGSPLLHEFGEDTGLVEGFPAFGHVVEDAVTLGAALPEWNHFLLVFLNLAVGDGVVLDLAAAEHLEVLHGVAVQFGERRHGFGLGSTLADDELVVADVDPLLGAEVVEVLGPEDGDRVFPLVLPVKFGFDQCPFDSERRLGVDRLRTQHIYSFSHNIRVF